VIIDLEAEPESAPGRDRRRALTLAFALCLAIGSAGVGRDGPAGTTDEPLRTTMFSRDGTRVIAAPLNPDLSLPPNTTDVLLSMVPDRLANEAWPPLQFVPVRVRTVTGLASEGLRPGDYRMVTWIERGNAYWLVSSNREIADLVKLADSLR
jgi:hypothetical protein